MAIWSRWMSRMRRMNQALLKSEEHLGSLAGAPAHLGNLTVQLIRTEQHLGFIAGILARQELAAVLADPRYADPLRLERSGFRVHSQYDEDGIISEIFRRIGEQSRLFVEFGSGNGSENCTGFLLMQGWRGLWIDAGESNLTNVERMWAAEIGRGQLVARRAFITVDTIDAIIREAGFAGEIDLLSVDLDGNDYHVLKKIEVVAPRAICVEYNGNFPPHVAWTQARDDGHMFDGVDYRVGASLKALEQLLSDRGYALVGCSLAGVNAFFVRKDLAEGKFAQPFTAENHYNPWRSFYGGSASGAMWRGWRS